MRSTTLRSSNGEEYLVSNMPPNHHAQQPMRKSKARRIAGIGCAGFSFFLFAVIGFGVTSAIRNTPVPGSGTPDTGTATAKGHTVTYSLTGTADNGADVTYGPSGSGLSGKVPMNLTKPLQGADSYSLTAQLQGGGNVTCKIAIDGKVISQATATGGYNIAMCQVMHDPINGRWISAN